MTELWQTLAPLTFGLVLVSVYIIAVGLCRRASEVYARNELNSQRCTPTSLIEPNNPEDV